MWSSEPQYPLIGQVESDALVDWVMAKISSGTYGFGVTISGPFDSAKEQVKAVFKENGFGTLSEIDVQATLNEKIGEVIEPYTILGVCNPRLAIRAIGAEHEIGLLLPCNVLLHECEGGVHVSVQDPQLLVGITGNEGLAAVAAEAREGITRALESLR